MNKIWQDFTGGMNHLAVKSLLQPGEYHLLINGRVRKHVVENVRRPREMVGPVAEKYQCIIAIDNLLVLVADGYVYTKDCAEATSAFVKNSDIRLDPGVDVIYGEVVPASNINYKRNVDSAVKIDPEVEYRGKLLNSPVGIVLQDGVSQPIIVTPDGNVRVTQNFNQWSTENNREYVPIGKQMRWDGNTLFIVGDKKCFRSVSGRPLDFCIAVTKAGKKVEPEEDGGADALSVGNVGNDITCVASLNNQTRDVFISTRRGSIALSPSDLYFFGEPYYNVRTLVTGALNQNSFINILGDNVFVDIAGIKSFNAVESTLQASKYAEFNYAVSDMFVKQSDPAAISFNTYAYFYIDTIYGKGILVYDQITESFISFDQFDELTGLKQFAVCDSLVDQSLVYITNNKIYEYEVGTKAAVELDVGQLETPDAGKEIVPTHLFVTFDAEETGEVTVKLDTNGSLASTFSHTTDSTGIVVVPFGLHLKKRRGTNIGIRLSWNFAATLKSVQLSYDLDKTVVPLNP